MKDDSMERTYAAIYDAFVAREAGGRIGRGRLGRLAHAIGPFGH